MKVLFQATGGNPLLFQRLCVGAFQIIDLREEIADLASKISQLDVLALHERLLFSKLHLQISDLCIEDRFQLAGPVGRDFKSTFFFLKLGVQCSNFRFNPLANLFCLCCGEASRSACERTPIGLSLRRRADISDPFSWSSR